MTEKLEFEKDYFIPKIITGCWQLSKGHAIKSDTNKKNINNLLFKYLYAGLNTFDCADIYIGVEEILGDFRKLAEKKGYKINTHTKFVPNLNDLVSIKETQIKDSIYNSCKRLQSESLDLVQFHWWDYE